MKRKSSVVSPYLWQEGGYIRPAQFVLLVLLLLSVSANDIQKNFIAQDNACAGGSNTITITLQVATCSPQLKLHANCLATPVHLTLPSTPGSKQAVPVIYRVQANNTLGITSADQRSGSNWTARSFASLLRVALD
jgi:hypothetical protein